MFNTIQSFHSHFRWIIFLMAAIALIIPFINKNSQEINKKQKLPALLFMITMDIQVLLGLLLYFVYSPYGLQAFDMGMSAVMKTTDIRKIAVEHFTMMLLAFVLVHIGYSKIKKADSAAKISKHSLVFFGIALICILASIPWSRL